VLPIVRSRTLSVPASRRNITVQVTTDIVVV